MYCSAGYSMTSILNIVYNKSIDLFIKQFTIGKQNGGGGGVENHIIIDKNAT